LIKTTEQHALMLINTALINGINKLTKMYKTINVKTIKGLKLFNKYIKLNWSIDSFLINKKIINFVVIKKY
jgi:hypothetical protein